MGTLHRVHAWLVLAACGALVACATTSRPAPPPEPTEEREPKVATPAEPACPGPVAEDPQAAFEMGRELVMSSSDRQHRGGLTYQAGMERLLESARGGHADGHYLYGWRRFLDAAERRLPQEGDAAEREVYVEALVHIALAAERGQLDAIAFYPAAVLQGLLAPLTPYTCLLYTSDAADE